MACPSRSCSLGRSLLVAAALAGLAGCGGGGGMSAAASGTPFYAPTAYVASAAGAAHVDASLVNPWGIAYGPATDFWVADQATGLATVYDGLGAVPAPDPRVTVAAAAGAAPKGPTGVVYNGTAGFSGYRFIFAGLDGTLSGWTSGAVTVIAVDRHAAGASYTGLALATVAGGALAGDYLYAANFTGGTVDVFDAAFAPASLGAGAFTDPGLPSGYAPFGIQALGGKVYVAYAIPVAGSAHATAGAGLGLVDVFNPDGTMIGRLVSPGGTLDAPWGLAMAPAGFGPLGGSLLVGNFGDGRISAFNPATGASRGQLSGASGVPLAFPGLWGIVFGNGAGAGSAGQLYYAAGGAAENQGVFGTVAVGQPVSVGGGGY